MLEKAHARYRSSNSLHDYQVFKDLRAQYKIRTRERHENYVLQAESRIKSDPQTFWRYINNLKASDGQLPGKMFHGDRVVNAGDDIVELFAHFFSQVFVSECVVPHCVEVQEVLDVTSLSFSPVEVFSGVVSVH
ncbi:hypothetical protein HHI36_013722 [Cryptolaemus montrouzieri]|uniref:Uncharacterized protein n=1 Tax=Cryptolaemus montrouzieri TaxID=559131 RepID=A0ABD2NIH6_9CUCU